MSKPLTHRIICRNKKAKFNFAIEDSMEVGIVLKGSEVKSLRLGKINLEDAHATPSGNEIYIHNLNIAEYEKANQFNHETRRPRKLLLHRSEINKIIGKVQQKGYSLVALSMYFNNKNIAKVELALAKGKKLHDKRDAIKEKDQKREQQRALKKHV